MLFSTVAIAFYVGHHLGDYWFQSDNDARHKGDAGATGRLHCLSHVISYTATQLACLLVTLFTLDLDLSWWKVLVGLAVSAVTHYMADRREHGLMFWIARRIPGKANFLELGKPRASRVIEAWFDCARCQGRGSANSMYAGQCSDCRGGGKLPSSLTIDDNPTLGTGAWALDQSWHLFWGVFVAALVIAA